MSGRDMMGSYTDRTGKTFAYLLPLLKNYTSLFRVYSKIVILVPTRRTCCTSSGKVEKQQYMSGTLPLGILVALTLIHSYLSGCDILWDSGRIMDLTLDNVIRFEEMQS
jgi:ATP-dependent RNA helicase RhlE